MLSYDDALTKAQTVADTPLLTRQYTRQWNALEDELSAHHPDQINAIIAQAVTEHRARYAYGAMILMTMADFILNPSK